VNLPISGARNRLLAILSDPDRDLLTPALEAVALDLRQVLEAPNEPISHAYFLESGLVSIVGTAPPAHRIEIGMVGSEGMTGLSIVLGGDRSVNETMVQSAGTALRISTGSLRRMLEASRSLTATLLRYVNVFMVQGSQTALANGRGLLDERLARWLLMWHDLAGGFAGLAPASRNELLGQGLSAQKVTAAFRPPHPAPLAGTVSNVASISLLNRVSCYSTCRRLMRENSQRASAWSSLLRGQHQMFVGSSGPHDVGLIGVGLRVPWVALHHAFGLGAHNHHVGPSLYPVIIRGLFGGIRISVACSVVPA
jgi:CRP-like cAMP-binding protein